MESEVKKLEGELRDAGVDTPMRLKEMLEDGEALLKLGIGDDARDAVEELHARACAVTTWGYDSGDAAPALDWRDGQSQPQRAYLLITPTRIYLETEPLGGGCSEQVWRGEHVRVQIPAGITQSGLDAIYRDEAVMWSLYDVISLLMSDERNRDEIEEAVGKAERAIEAALSSASDYVWSLYDAYEYLRELDSCDISLKTTAADIQETARESGVWIRGGVERIERALEMLRAERESL